MKKLIATIFTCILLGSVALIAFAQGKSNSGNSLSKCISVKSGRKSFNVAKKSTINLKDYNFDICIDNITTEDDVCLFAFYNDEYMNKYKLPINKDDTDIFCPGSGLAENDLDAEKGYSLSINKPFTFHYLHAPRRINKENSCVIPVREITDPTGEFADKIYFSIFVDYNKNGIIEEQEYATFVISF